MVRARQRPGQKARGELRVCEHSRSASALPRDGLSRPYFISAHTNTNGRKVGENRARGELEGKKGAEEGKHNGGTERDGRDKYGERGKQEEKQRDGGWEKTRGARRRGR